MHEIPYVYFKIKIKSLKLNYALPEITYKA